MAEVVGWWMLEGGGCWGGGCWGGGCWRGVDVGGVDVGGVDVGGVDVGGWMLWCGAKTYFFGLRLVCWV